MGVSKNNGTQIINFNRVFHYKPSILGYPYFWKHPYVTNFKNLGLIPLVLGHVNINCEFLRWFFYEIFTYFLVLSILACLYFSNQLMKKTKYCRYLHPVSSMSCIFTQILRQRIHFDAGFKYSFRGIVGVGDKNKFHLQPRRRLFLEKMFH